jgi:hypothetical protein
MLLVFDFRMSIIYWQTALLVVVAGCQLFWRSFVHYQILIINWCLSFFIAVDCWLLPAVCNSSFWFVVSGCWLFRLLVGCQLLLTAVVCVALYPQQVSDRVNFCWSSDQLLKLQRQSVAPFCKDAARQSPFCTHTYRGNLLFSSYF